MPCTLYLAASKDDTLQKLYYKVTTRTVTLKQSRYKKHSYHKIRSLGCPRISPNQGHILFDSIYIKLCRIFPAVGTESKVVVTRAGKGNGD